MASPSFVDAQLSAMSLAKLGDPAHGESLQTSRTLCRFHGEEAELLTHCFLKSFRSLELHQLHHHTQLAKNELYSAAVTIFDDNDSLLEQGAMIARHLHANSRHPNIKPGDLCVALIDGISLGGQTVQALSIIKSESRVPFLQISEREGDLVLTTEQGIYPDKIDKGCLIINHDVENGFAVYLFDKSSSGAQFWVRDFAGARPVTNEDFLTRRYAELCSEFAKRGLPEGTPAEDRMELAGRATQFLQETEQFDREEFHEKALATPERIAQFDAFKVDYEEEQGGEPLPDQFSISPKEAKKAVDRLKSSMRLDVGVELKFSRGFLYQAKHFLERGHDEEKQMEYIKIYYRKEEE